MDLLSLVMMCAPFVAPNTMMAIVQVESSGNPWAIGVNTSHRFQKPASYEQAVSEAKRLISRGANFDMGLSQLNYKTMLQLGLTVEQAFDPCTNVYAGGTVLTRNYVNAAKNTSNDQAALQAALSAYNTGNFHKGFRNGYVRKVVEAGLRTNQRLY